MSLDHLGMTVIRALETNSKKYWLLPMRGEHLVDHVCYLVLQETFGVPPTQPEVDELSYWVQKHQGYAWRPATEFQCDTGGGIRIVHTSRTQS